MRDCIVKSLVILVANVILLGVAAYAGLTSVDRARAPAAVQTASLGSSAARPVVAESRDANAWPAANCDSNVLVGALGVDLDASDKSRRCSLSSLATIMADLRIADAGENIGVLDGAFDRTGVIESLRGEYLSSSRFAEPVFVEGPPGRVARREVGSSGGK
jgi:hypothetical protein